VNKGKALGVKRRSWGSLDWVGANKLAKRSYFLFIDKGSHSNYPLLLSVLRTIFLAIYTDNQCFVCFFIDLLKCVKIGCF
jgi:hypothetical protein